MVQILLQMTKPQIKSHLLHRLQKEHAFWSYDKSSCQEISDYNLIKHVLMRLDLPDINLLFGIFSKRKIKRVWLDELVPQGDYLRNMNLCFASLYFDIKRPLQYLKAMESYKMNKI